MPKRARAGRSLELLVSSLEKALGTNANAHVKSPAFLPDKITGEDREHDVLLTVSSSHHKTLIGIECRDRSRKITVNDVEGFWSKCQDTGIDQGVIVSPKGFSKTALTKAAHRNIRCLQLAEVASFNWLLASSLQIRNRMVKHTNWTFYPAEDLNPLPTTFTILTREGDPVEAAGLNNAVLVEFNKMPVDDEQENVGQKRIMFNVPNVVMRDDATGKLHDVSQALAVVDYEVVHSYVPLKLVSYANAPSGELITDAAIAELDIGAVKGKLMIVYKQDEGGSVVFVPGDAAP